MWAQKQGVPQVSRGAWGLIMAPLWTRLPLSQGASLDDLQRSLASVGSKAHLPAAQRWPHAASPG